MTQQEEKYDIFVSYAHKDNANVFNRDGWVSTLVENLQQLLQESENDDQISIWWDKANLNPYDPVTPEVRQRVKNSSILLLILSPKYLESRWCQEEMALFFQTLEDNSQKRVFVAYKYPLRKDQSMPEELEDLLGYQFWYKEAKNSRFRTMTIDDEEPHKINFIKLVLDLAVDLSEKLKVINAVHPLPQKISKATVYLAEVTDDLEPQSLQVRRYLENAQIQVLPSRRHLEGQNFKDALNEDLPKCNLFIQLLGNVVGKTPPETPQGYARLQLEKAQSSNLQIFQWRDPYLNIDEVEPPKQRELLMAETVYAQSLETFKEMVVKKATLPSTALPNLIEEPIEPSPFVLINAENRDRLLAEMIRDRMDSRFLRAFPDNSGSPDEIWEDLERKLAECDALIIVYGQAPVTWVEHQILHCNRTKPKRKQSLRILGIYDGPPKGKPEISMRLDGMEILQFRNGLDEHRLNEFLAPLLEGNSDD